MADEHVVVFAGRIFRFQAGDPAARAETAAYGRKLGIPPAQLGWQD